MTLIKSDAADYDGRPYRSVGKDLTLPTAFELNQNYPNPFNPATVISFALPHQSEWSLRIFNITGALVREYGGANEAGSVAVEWDGRTELGQETASGVYFYRLDAGEFNATRKMILLK